MSSSASNTRLTFDAASDEAPVWSPDAKRIAFSSNRSGRYELYVKDSGGARTEHNLATLGVSYYLQ